MRQTQERDAKIKMREKAKELQRFGFLLNTLFDDNLIMVIRGSIVVYCIIPEPSLRPAVVKVALRGKRLAVWEVMEDRWEFSRRRDIL